MGFIEKLNVRIKAVNSLLCVGLDTDINKIPEHIRSEDFAKFKFNKIVIDATHDLVCAYKPQLAFYSADGTEKELELTIGYIIRKYPEIAIILDAKKNDIGNTAKMYAQEAFERYRADAVTVNPYMGGDTLKPFTDYKDKGVIILCRTSNPGSGDIQGIDSNGTPVYKIVAKKAVTEWNENNNILLVVGATYPKELAEVRAIVGDNTPFLVPGIGAQGGDVEAVVTNGKNSEGTGMVINSSRGIIYAGGNKNNFAELIRQAATDTRDEINLYR